MTTRWLLPLLLGGCFSPNYADSFPCGTPPNECPEGYTCTTGLCTKNGSQPTPDAPLAIDGPEDVDAPPTTGPLHVKVYDPDGIVAVGVAVAFHAPDGHVVAVRTTDAAGMAQNDITAGSAVTVGFLDRALRPDRLQTVAGVKPGQTITFGRPQLPDPIALTAMVTLPGGAPAATTGYSIEAGNAPCFATASPTQPNPISVPVYQHCVTSASTYSVIAYADDSQGRHIAYSALTNRPIATTALTMPAWQTTFGSFQVNLANAPAVTSAPCVASDAGPPVCGVAELGVSLLGVPFRPEPTSERPFAIAPGGSTTVSFRIAPSLFDGLRYTVIIPYGPTRQDGGGFYVRQLLSVPTNDPVNLGTTLFPRVRNARVDAGTVPFVLRFDADAATVGADALSAEVEWTPVPDGGQTNTRRWRLLGPPDLVSPVTFPDLPTEYAAYLPAGSVVEDASAIYFELSPYDGYDEFVTQLGLALFGDGGFPPGDLTGRATGIVR